MAFTLLITLFTLAHVAAVKNSRQSVEGLSEAAAHHSAQSTAFFDSLVGLFATENLAKPTINSVPEAEELKAAQERKSKAVLSYFLDNEVLPELEPVLENLFGEATCTLAEYDSVTYEIEIQVLPPNFTIRNVVGVIAGYCVNPVIALIRDTYTVKADTAQNFNIDLEVKSMSANSWRSLRVEGDVFIPAIPNNNKPFKFYGDFAWKTLIGGLYQTLQIDLQKRVPVNGWGSVTEFCFKHVEGGPTDAAVTDCTAKGLIITGENGQDICKIDPLNQACELFEKAYCEAVTSSIIGSFFKTEGSEIYENVNSKAPLCFSQAGLA